MDKSERPSGKLTTTTGKKRACRGMVADRSGENGFIERDREVRRVEGTRRHELTKKRPLREKNGNLAARL